MDQVVVAVMSGEPADSGIADLPQLHELEPENLVVLLEKHDGKRFTVCDLRDSIRFREAHVLSACSFSCSRRLLQCRALKEMRRLIRDAPSLYLVVYIDSGDLLGLDLTRTLVDLNRVFLLRGGFDKFSAVAPASMVEKEQESHMLCSPSNPDFVSENILTQPMTKIQANLYIGNQRDSEDEHLLTAEGITDVLCLNHKCRVPHHNQFKVTDSISQDLIGMFPKMCSFIENVHSREGKVLVHCAAGVSRSVTVVIAHLIFTSTKEDSQDGILDILARIQAVRPIACPNFNFLGQLDRYRRSLLQQRGY